MELCKLRELIFNSLTEGICVIDREGVISAFNFAAARLTGVPAAEAIGHGYREIMRSDTCQGEGLLRATMDSGEALIDVPCSLIRRDGRRVSVRVNASPVREDEGEIVGAVATFRDVSEVELLRKELSGSWTHGDIVTKSPAMLRLLDILPEVAASGSTVLIYGETGTGKELFARAIHHQSPRAAKPFVAVNCGALPDTLLESELFGYRKGAFTDAKKEKPGRFARAEGGTLFLDEIGDISAAMQVKLLRVLQEREYEPLGSTSAVRADVRIVAATNRDLAAMVKEKQFRADLFYRLNVVPLRLLPLRERREDIPLLADHVLHRLGVEKGRSIQGIAPGALRRLLAYDWPGNVRELENVLERALVICRNPWIEADCLPDEIGLNVEPAKGHAEGSSLLDMSEAEAIRAALQRSGGNRKRCAGMLNIHPTTLWRKMQRYGLK